MNIIVLAAELPWPLDQGDKLRNYYLIKALAVEHEVTLVCFCSPGEERGPWQDELRLFCGEIHTLPLSRREMIVNVLKNPCLPVTVAARSSGEMADLVRDLTRKKNYEIALACQLKMSGYLEFCRSGKKVAELTDFLTAYQERKSHFAGSLSQRIVSSIEKSRTARWEKKIAGYADLTVLVSAHDAEALKQIAPEARIAVLPIGVNLDYFTPLPDPGKPSLIFFGHLRYPPNADAIVWFGHEIFPRLRKEIPEAELFIVGKEPPPEVKRVGKMPGVSFIGYVPDVRSYLERAALVVVPVRFGGGVRIKILEAMAAGRAVVSTSLGCEGLEVVPGVHLEVADDPLTFAGVAAGLLRDFDRRALMAEKGRQLVKTKYNWEAIGQQFRDILKQVYFRQ